MSTLFIIPARGGSKGIPGKNIKPFMGKPLIHYALETAQAVATAGDVICVSTDDDAIVASVKDFGLEVPFKRPATFATDNAGMHEVLIHALEFYENQGRSFDKIVLLQPTSPFRKPRHVQEALASYSPEMDMLVSVKEARANPYYTLAEEDANGFLKRSKSANFVRRQDCPAVFEYNGAVYVINVAALKQQPLHTLTKIKKYVMDELESMDLDTPVDWIIAECIAEKALINE